MNSIVQAVYTEQIIDDYKGNPFIEALPPIYSKEEVIDKIASYPDYSEEDRLLDDSIRIHIISQKLMRVFQPLSRHIDLERKISTMIRNGYIARNPISREYIQSFISGYKDINKIHYVNNKLIMTANSLSIIGTSGLGKTSSINRVLNTMPQIIQHSIYRGSPLNIKQVTWIKIDCSFDGGMKSLIYNFFGQVDSILGTNYFEKYSNGKRNTDTLLSIMTQVCKNIGLGLLVLDEVQHLSVAKSNYNSDKVLNFFTTLVNTIGIPVILIGTMAARDILQADFRMARRNMGCDGNIVWDRLRNDESWELLIDAIWQYQYTKKNSQLTKEISDLVYYECQGIIDIAIKIMSMSQIEAISTGSEEITVDIIKKVVNNSMSAVKPMMLALKSGDIKKIARFKDICTEDYEDILKDKEKEIDLKKRIDEYRDAKRKKKLGKKEEALKKLVKLDINKKKAIIAIDNILKNNSSIGVNKLVVEAIKEVDNIRLIDKNEIRFSEDDIRKIVAISDGVDGAYFSLLNKGYIANADSDWEDVI